MRNSRVAIVLLLALLMAGGAVLAAARWMSGQGASASQTVMVALVDIGVGAKVTPAMLRGMDWPAGVLPPGTFGEADALPSAWASLSWKASLQHPAPPVACRPSWLPASAP